MQPEADGQRPFLLDVSRLVWRVWRGGLPTGIDRVCLAYLDHFGPRARAVVQREGLQFLLSPDHSDRLFALLRGGNSTSRSDLLRLAARALPATLGNKPHSGSIYLNVGHTGLHEESLPRWIARHCLKAIYLVHDLIPLTHPQYCRAGEAEKHRARMENVLASAAGIIGNSQSTLDELEAFAKARNTGMPPSIAALIGASEPPATVRPRSYPKPYFVTVGTIEGRKNHILLLEVWRRLAAELGENAPTLVIIGQRGWEAGPALAILDHLADLSGHVVELEACPDEQLAEWVAGARALLMPSAVEGFGLPVIEALQLGVPVIARDLPVYHEIAGAIPTYIDPLDDSGWEPAIRQFLGDTPERERQLRQVRSYRPPDWVSHFTMVEAWLQNPQTLGKQRQN